MTTWEYKILDSKNVEGGGFMKSPSAEEVERYLNALGAEGWEIVHLDWRELESRMSFSGVAKRARVA